MFRLLPAALLVLATTMLTPRPAEAIIVTLDDSSLTVVRPLTGTTRVDFTGNITLTDGFDLSLASLTPLFNESGNSLAASFFPDVPFNLSGVLFSMVVSATDALGHYAYWVPPTSAASIAWFECPVGGGFCNSSGNLNYSVDVVAAAVPEPSTLALFGIGGLALYTFRRRRNALTPA